MPVQAEKILLMTKNPDDIFLKFTSGIKSGLIKGLKGFLWLLKIIIPISFATSLALYFGLIDRADFLLNPLMKWLCLPPSAAIVLITGLFTGIYGTIAAMSVIPFSVEQMTLMAVFSLISHNILQESIVQGNSGINPFIAGCFRLMMAFLVTFICARLMGLSSSAVLAGGSLTAVNGRPDSFMSMLTSWSLDTLKLTLQILCIIMPLMVTLELAKIFNIIHLITKLISPLLKLMGLTRSTGMLWITATVFGLSYGAAVIVEETREKRFERHELSKLHLSIGINHSMIEDPALFLPFGLSVFWLWIPRLIAAIVVVRIYSLFVYAGRIYAKHAEHKKFCNH